jgi:hypothetical protein
MTDMRKCRWWGSASSGLRLLIVRHKEMQSWVVIFPERSVGFGGFGWAGWATPGWVWLALIFCFTIPHIAWRGVL